MSAFFVYILQSAVCLAVLFLFYSILLSRETFYRYNRVALLCLIPLSFVLPLCHLPLFAESESVPPATVVMLDNLSAFSYVTDEVEVTTATVPVALVVAIALYWAGVVFFIARYIITVVRLLRLMSSGRRVTDDEGRQIIVLPRSIAPFSWFGRIVLSEEDYAAHSREILLHESAHIRKRHSFDLLAADLCTWLQWFNPAAWLLKRELQTVHEYEADAEVIDQGIDARQYQLLLIKRSVGSKFYCVTNHFNHNKLNKRITMMLKKKSNRKATWKYLYVIPVALCTVTVFARPEVSERLDEIASTDLLAMLDQDDSQSATDQSQMVITAASNSNQTNTLNVNIDESGDSSQGNKLKINITENGKPTSMDSALCIVDGKKVSREEIDKLSPDQIKSVTVLKGKMAVEKYGDEAKGGALLISTKESDDTQPMKITLSNDGKQGSQKSYYVINGKKVPAEVIDNLSTGKFSYIINGKEVSAEDMEKLNLSGQVGNISILNDNGENTIIIHSKKSSLNNWQQQVKALSDSIRAEVAVTKEGKELSPEAMARIEALSARISANADSITRAIDEKGINALSTLNHHTDSVSAYVKQIPNIIYVVDGKKVSEKKFNKLSPNDIASITVLKGGEANKKYGAKENDNVLIITTRKKK
ncbi:M56 family metallopeptidase [Barnesiella viscericola]|uniref:M56 family metallopeptidase n=1 Tax=Barnesiella viscericola TaxID=397865 RepID=UPI0025A34A89|nr:M56 family metallopeptidase [Barnesiella viscericola]MDM8269702.1 M56 family metallopeptidase [Barnesiella viscericola]